MYQYYEFDLQYCSYFKLSEDDTAVLKHVAMISDCTAVSIIRAFGGYGKRKSTPLNPKSNG